VSRCTVAAAVKMERSLRGDGSARRWLTLVCALAVVGCGPGIVSTATFGPTQPGSSAGESAAATPGLSILPTAAPTGAPTVGPTATPVPITPHLNAGFQYSDILRVRVNALAVRKQPKRTASLLHEWDVLADPAPVDRGEVRLNKGDFVSVHLGPLPIGDTVWYQVWEAEDGHLHDSDYGWYAKPPFDGSLVPGWSAVAVGANSYMTLERHPSLEEIESFLPLGVNLAGFGSWSSDPQPRHDGFLFDWAAAAPIQGTACTFAVRLVPEGGAAPPFLAAPSVSLTGVKVAPLGGTFIDTSWLPAPDGSWEQFRLVVDSTCNWAVRLTPLHHD
jgi:hypothetical protein